MPRYRIYQTMADGQRSPPVDAICSDDGDAKSVAQRLLRVADDKAEVWIEDRLVAVVTGPQSADIIKLGLPWETGVVKGRTDDS